MPPTKQPVWELIANLGDANPLDFDGYFIYRDKTGVYPEEAVVLERETDDDAARSLYTIYRFPLERLKLVAGYLVPLDYSPGWPNYIFHRDFLSALPRRPGVLDWWPEGVGDPLHAKKYNAWFQEGIPVLANTIGITAGELETAFTSVDPLVRAEAYRAIGLQYGWLELDSYPIRNVTRKEVRRRYGSAVKERQEKVVTLKTMLAIVALAEGEVYSGEELARQGCFPESLIPSRGRVVEIVDAGGDTPIIVRVVAQ